MRIVKHAIGAFCLLAALLLAVVWVRSYWVSDRLYRSWYTDDGVQLTYHREICQISPGQLKWARDANIVDLRQYDHLSNPEKAKAEARAIITAQQPETPLSYERRPAPRPTPARPWHGFEREAIGDRATHDAATERQEQPVDALAYWSRTYAIPIWLPLLIFAVPAGWWGLWLLSVLRRRRGAHECPNCGYDLRATPDRCPECGTPAARGG